jgi:hypothetical protein
MTGLAVPAVIWLAAGVEAGGHSCSRCSHLHHRDCNDRVGCRSAVCGRVNGGGPAALDFLEGAVTEVNYLRGATPEEAMVEIKVASGQKQALVRLAPSGFLRDKEIEVQAGDAIQVSGYRATGLDGERLIATTVVLNGRLVRLRDDRGRTLR